MSLEMRRVRICMAPSAAAKPSALPAAINTSPSVMNWRTRRPRDAPSAPRTAISRLRLAGRNSRRLDTLTHANNHNTPKPPHPRAAQQHEQDGPDIGNDHFRQRQHTGALIAIVVGILQFQLPRNRLHLGAGHLHRDAILEPSDSVEVVAAAAERALIGSVQRSPELYISSEIELEILRQHSDDGIKNTAESDGFAADIFSSAKPFLPSGVAQNHGSGSARQILAREKIPAQDRSYS